MIQLISSSSIYVILRDNVNQSLKKIAYLSHGPAAQYTKQNNFLNLVFCF